MLARSSVLVKLVSWYSKPWGSSKCNDKHRLKHLFRRHSTVAKKIIFRRTEAVATYEVKQGKRNSCSSYFSEFTSLTPTLVIFNRIARLQNKTRKQNNPYLLIIM